MAELAGTRAIRLAQIATLVITGQLIVILAVAVRDQLSHRRAGGFAVVLLALLEVALILAGFPVDVPMLSGGTPATWNGWVHGIAFRAIGHAVETSWAIPKCSKLGRNAQRPARPTSEAVSRS